MLALALVAAMACLVASDARAQSFEGKTLRIMVNFTAGGALDTFVRAIVPHLKKHLPGGPLIVVENRPGAAGRVGAAFLYNVVKPDGLTIGALVGAASDDVFGIETNFDANKFTWLGAVPQTQVTIVRRELNVKSPADLRRPSKPIVMATTGKNSNNFIASSLALSMLNVDYKPVFGYAGQPASIHALRQGEANLTDAGAPFYLPNRETWLQEGLFAILQRGDLQPDGSFKRSPLIPDVPTMPEAIQNLNPDALKTVEYAAYRLIAGTYALQYAIVAPPSVEPQTAEALRKAVSAAFMDPAAIADVKRQLRLEYNFLTGRQAMQTLENLQRVAQQSPQARTLLAKLAKVK
jgi:tripartite-type tricarboxylate transporter receptor subunit TctC